MYVFKLKNNILYSEPPPPPYMKRKVNRTKRAKMNTQGFKTYKNFKLYISEGSSGDGWSARWTEVPRPELVDAVRDLWNTDSTIKAMRKHIKAISITSVKTIKIAGLWNLENQKISVKDNHRDSISFYKSVFVHEIIGHTFWDFARKWRREELIAFNKLANELAPVTDYVRDNEKKWRQWNDDDEERKKFEAKYDAIYEDDIDSVEYQKDVDALEELYKLNGHDGMTRYANEQHSAISEIVYGHETHQQLLNVTDVQRLVELWERLHY